MREEMTSIISESSTEKTTLIINKRDTQMLQESVKASKFYTYTDENR